MKRALAILILLGLAGGAVFWFLTMPKTLPADTFASIEGDPEKGKLVFFAGGCSSCHAVPDAKGDEKLKLGGGLKFATPFGTFFAPNISSDRQHGIGGWTVLQFANAVMRGVSPGGSHYYPAFPYTSYQRMSFADVADLKAYMDTLPAVTEPHKPHELSFPFNIRRGLGLWKLLYVDGKQFVPDPKASAEINRGAYLVTGPGHCGECHTPRDRFGGLDRDKWLAGAANPDGEGTIPNITPHESGIKGWSAEDIVNGLKTGFTPEFDTFGGSMVPVQENMAKLPDSDLKAIAAYLKSIPALPDAAPRKKEK